MVFLGPNSFCYTSIELFVDELSKGNAPELFFIKGRGVFSKPDFSSAKKAQLKCYFDILVRQKKYHHLTAMTVQKIGDLLNWDAEKYRQSLAK